MEQIGHDLNGTPIHSVRLRGDGITATILSYGAILQDLRIAGHAHSLVLGYRDLEPYLADQNYFGATVGRVANRIRDGVALIDGVHHQLDQNSGGVHHLHGGSEGTARRCWRVVEYSQTHATLEDVLPDGHMGYTGTLTVQVRFSVLPAQKLSIEITAQSDAATLCNFAHHSYFNLADRSTIAGHTLRVAAGRYLPVDESGIPTGQVRNVADTEFDFRSGRRILEGQRYDHTLCLANQRRALRRVARLSSPAGKTQMEIATTEAGLQIYTGHGINAVHGGGGQAVHGPFSGIALEPQSWPDAPRHPNFPSVLLHAGETYQQITTFQFSAQRGG